MNSNRGLSDLLAEMDGKVVAVFHAHPDDEVFATAVTTLRLAAAGAEVRLCIATGGELGERGADLDLDEVVARGIRERRLDQSCKLLGISRWSYLTQPGEWVDTTEASKTLAAAPKEVVAAAVRAVIDDWQPEIVLSVGPDGLTGHPDHIAMHDAVAAALALPGWRPRHTWGAVVVDSDVRAAHASLEQLGPGGQQNGGHENVAGVSASLITQTIHNPGVAAIRKRAMDLYLDGLGSYPISQLISQYGLRGASLTLRALFDMSGWEVDHFISLNVPNGS